MRCYKKIELCCRSTFICYWIKRQAISEVHALRMRGHAWKTTEKVTTIGGDSLGCNHWFGVGEVSTSSTHFMMTIQQLCGVKAPPTFIHKLPKAVMKAFAAISGAQWP